MASDAPPFEFLWVVKESAYGVTKNAPVAGVDSMYIRLDGANRFDMRPKKVTRRVQWGGGFAIPGYTVSDQDICQGKLDVTLCYSQAKLLLDWAVTKINNAQTAPWTTTEPIGDLSSCSVFHGLKYDDGTVKRRKYSGVKIGTGKLSTSAEVGLVTLSLGLRARKYDGNPREGSSDPDSGAFPPPADTAFPTDPLLFMQTDTLLKLGGAALVYPESLDLSWTNVMDWWWSSSYFPRFDHLRGRQSQMEFKVLYTASPDFRGLYEAITQMAAETSFYSGTNTVKLNYNGNNLIDPIADDLTPGKMYAQTFTLINQHDTSASDDINFVYT